MLGRLAEQSAKWPILAYYLHARVVVASRLVLHVQLSSGRRESRQMVNLVLACVSIPLQYGSSIIAFVSIVMEAVWRRGDMKSSCVVTRGDDRMQ